MKSKKLIKWGIIGVGDVCEVKSGPAFQKIEGSELVAVMRRSSDLAQDYAQRHEVEKWYSNADELINDPDINAVYIATPPSSHAEYVKRVAEAGKIVYVEKPMARTYDECLSMIDACKAANVPLFVAYYRRSLPNFLKIKELLESKAIGDVRFVNIFVQKPLDDKDQNSNNWRVNPDVSGGGYFYDLACHQLDALDFLFGPIKNANGYAANQTNSYAGDDLVVGNFVFENGIIGSGVWSFAANKVSQKETTIIVGSKGQISFPCFGDHSVMLEVEGKEPIKYEFNISPNIQQPFIQSIINELNGDGVNPSHGESAARTNWVMEQICNSGDRK